MKLGQAMLDLHCHLLPGIDDGPTTLAEALSLARLAVANGISKSVVTPHIHPGRYENDIHTIRTAYLRFQAELERENIPLQLGMAAEVRIGAEILPMLSSGLLPFLGVKDDKQVILLEFPHSHIPPGSEKLIAWLMDRDILPMIAHPERNKSIIRDLEKMLPFVEMGCLFQVTAGSLAGDFGEWAQERAEQMLGRGWVSILASDAHNLQPRPPNLEPGRAAAARLVGEQESWRLVRDVPHQLTAETI
ncbi:MAG: capsular biosynthesis protein [Methylococcaceae bacterium]|nr:capsular biosynthesis protein [Methylococcaceae bacterium]